jgi:hypothetical protein
MSRCQAGDIAVVVDATSRDNIGRIVTVVRRCDGEWDVPLERPGPVWLVRAWSPLTWRTASEVYRRLAGPVPDYQLQPIRPTPLQAWYPGCQEEPIGMDDPRYMAWLQARIDVSMQRWWGADREPDA